MDLSKDLVRDQPLKMEGEQLTAGGKSPKKKLAGSAQDQ